MDPIPTTPPIDVDALNEHTMGLQDLQASLLRGFVEDLGARMALLRAALAQDDAKALWHGAHYLKGASLQLGCKPLAEAALALELAARRDHMEDAPALLEALEAEAARLPAAVAEYLGGR